MKSVCIMGGGLGGLMTGALLTREGYRVVVFEKNAILGGGLQSFRRGKYMFDTGMHIFGGMGEGGQLRRICRYLGIEERLEIAPRHDTLMDASNGRRITLPFGRQAWAAKWCRTLPDINGVELTAYLDRMYAMTEQEPLYHLRPSESDLSLPDINLSVYDFIHHGFTDPLLRKIIPYISLFYGGRRDTPALLHALISCAHIEGTYTFTGGSISFARLLAGVIEEGGGEVHCAEEVTGIDTTGRKISAVHTSKGTYTADHYVSDMPISRLLEIIPASAFTPAFRRRIGEAPYSISALVVFIGLKPRTLCYNREAYYSALPCVDFWALDACSQDVWPRVAFALPCEDRKNPGFADTITMVCPMSYDFVRPWADSCSGQRPDDYYRWKQMMTRQAIRMIEPIGFEVPLAEAIDFIDSGSPLTIRDYYGTPCGAIYGIHRSSSNPMQASLNTRTRLVNLFLTGQDVNFHGMLGTSLTAILTAEAIVGRNVIVNQIRERQTT